MRSNTSSCPPHDIEAESAVLGAVLLAPAWLRACRELGLAEEEFYRQSHRLIYRAILALEGAGREIDHVTVAAQLALSRELDEAGGGEYVATLVERIPAIGNTRGYVAIVKELARRRELIRVGHELIAGVAAGESTDDLAARASRSLIRLGGSRTGRSLRFTAPATSWGAWRAPR